MSRDMSRQRGGVPLYVQLADRIAAEIRAGSLRPGDRVASEPELVRAYGVSRATAGKALERLEQAGDVRREQGRGTFVQGERMLQRRPRLTSFSDAVRRDGHVPTQRLVAVERLPAGADDLLAMRLGGGPVLRLKRVRMVDGDPVGVHTTVLPEAIGERAGLGDGRMRPPDASLYAQLEAIGVRMLEAEEHLQAVAASPTESELLGVAEGAPLMRVLRVSYGAEHAPIEAVDARYVGDRLDYSVSLVHPDARAAESGTTGEESTHAHQALGITRDGGRRGRRGGRMR